MQSHVFPLPPPLSHSLPFLSPNLSTTPTPPIPSMATTTTSSPFAVRQNYLPTPPPPPHCPSLPLPTRPHHAPLPILRCRLCVPPTRPGLRGKTMCKATEVTMAEGSQSPGGGESWVPVVPLAALPKGERRVIIQGEETILLLWYKDEVFAIENRSPAEGAYTEGLLNAKLTQDGCIVCPSTDSTFELRTGAIKEWYPKNPVLRALTPALRTLYVYPSKTDGENIYIKISGGLKSDASAEIVFSGRAQPGMTASDVNVDEVRMIIDDEQEGFGFSEKNELINGKAAVIGFLLLLDIELLTGKGLLKATGFLDFIYALSAALN